MGCFIFILIIAGFFCWPLWILAILLAVISVGGKK
jgi:hypothetical protein